MNRKTLLKLVVDCAMILSVLLAIANKLTENRMHESVGLFIVFLFFLHNILNWRWYSSILQGKYSMRRLLDIAVNLLFVLAMATLIGSSLMISRTLFVSLGIESTLTLRQVHTTAAYWFFILMAIHLGMHWARVKAITRRILPISFNQRVQSVLRWLLSIVIVFYGVKASFDRDVLSKLFMIYSFDFWDFEKSVVGFFINYVAIMGFYIVITHNALKVFQTEKR